MKLRSSVLSILLIGVLAVATSACGGGNASRGTNQPGKRAGGQRRPAVRVKTTPVLRIAVQRQVTLSGTLVSPNQVRVVNEVPGLVKEVLVELGNEVKAGAVLVRLDTVELELDVQRAESSLRQTEAQLGIAAGSGVVPADEQIASIRSAAANRDDARAQLDRAHELSQQGLLPKADLETAETRSKVTDAALQAALQTVRSLKASLQDRRAALALARKKLADATVRAPIDGSVSERLVQLGQYLRETPVVTLVQMNPLKLVTAVQEKYAQVIRKDQQVEFRVESLPGTLFKGRIAYISPAVDQTTRTLPVEILVDNSSRRLRPGFFAQGAILTEREENVPAVPDQAVSTLAGVSSVYVIKDGVVRQQNVKLGIREGELLEITGGLEGDEVLASSNLNELVSGVPVLTGEKREAGPAGAPEGEPRQRRQRPAKEGN
jgi:multidrug efflux pump subunit AcrA (membrane-fusion protein)